MQHPTKRRRFAVLAAGVALALVAAACGDDGGSDSSTASKSTTTVAAATGTSGSSGSAATTTAAAKQTGKNTPAPKPLAQRVTIKAGVAGKSFEAYSNLMLADALGEFEKENLKVEISVLPVPEMVALLTSGNLDVAPLGANAGPLNAISSGSDLAIVAAMPTFQAASKQGIWAKSSVVAADGTLDPCKMKGMTVALGSAALSNTVSLPLAKYLAKCNLTLKDIKVSTLTGPDVLVALKNGSVDAGFLADPAWAEPDSQGYAKLVVPFGTFSVNGYMMGKLRKDKPDVAAAFIRAMVRTSRTSLQGNYRTDPTVRAALKSVMGVTDATLDASLPLVFDPDLKYKNINEAIEVQKIWIDAGGILSYKEPLGADKILDETVLNKVLAE